MDPLLNLRSKTGALPRRPDRDFRRPGTAACGGSVDAGRAGRSDPAADKTGLLLRGIAIFSQHVSTLMRQRLSPKACETISSGRPA